MGRGGGGGGGGGGEGREREESLRSNAYRRVTLGSLC
jgi:hypothetical protein